MSPSKAYLPFATLVALSFSQRCSLKAWSGVTKKIGAATPDWKQTRARISMMASA